LHEIIVPTVVKVPFGIGCRWTVRIKINGLIDMKLSPRPRDENGRDFASWSDTESNHKAWRGNQIRNGSLKFEPVAPFVQRPQGLQDEISDEFSRW